MEETNELKKPTLNYGKMSYGFIVTRHVNSEKTNRYWNQCLKCIRRFYPYRKIVVIDDNSNPEYVQSFHSFQNVDIIQSEYHGRGELLPFIYLLKYHFFDNAVIIHDSVFIHKKINFDKIKLSVLPLWHFDRNIDELENKVNNVRIAVHLQNNHQVLDHLKSIIRKTNYAMEWRMSHAQWNGCFGVQCFINYNFLQHLEAKYKITNLLNHVRNRTDRCSLERIMGVLFNLECPQTIAVRSLLGDIFQYMGIGFHCIGYSFDDYEASVQKGNVVRPVVKVWTGR